VGRENRFVPSHTRRRSLVTSVVSKLQVWCRSSSPVFFLALDVEAHLGHLFARLSIIHPFVWCCSGLGWARAQLPVDGRSTVKRNRCPRAFIFLAWSLSNILFLSLPLSIRLISTGQPRLLPLPLPSSNGHWVSSSIHLLALPPSSLDLVVSAAPLRTSQRAIYSSRPHPHSSQRGKAGPYNTTSVPRKTPYPGIEIPPPAVCGISPTHFYAVISQ
jgi:hypothetical protein